MTPLTVALTDRLREDMLLTPRDYQRLNSNAIDRVSGVGSSNAFDWSGTEFECVVESDECNAPTIDCNADAVGMETNPPVQV